MYVMGLHEQRKSEGITFAALCPFLLVLYGSTEW